MSLQLSKWTQSQNPISNIIKNFRIQRPRPRPASDLLYELVCAQILTKKDVLSMSSITGVNLRRLGVHITTPLRARTTTGRKRGTIGGNCTSGGIMGFYRVVAFVMLQCKTGPFGAPSTAQRHVTPHFYNDSCFHVLFKNSSLCL